MVGEGGGTTAGDAPPHCRASLAAAHSAALQNPIEQGRKWRAPRHPCTSRLWGRLTRHRRRAEGSHPVCEERRSATCEEGWGGMGRDRGSE